MKRAVLPAAFVLAAAMAFAQQPPPSSGMPDSGQQPSYPGTGTQTDPGQTHPGAGSATHSSTKQITAQVVRTDPTAKTITIRKTDATGSGSGSGTESGSGSMAGASNEKTLSVESAATSSLNQYSAGDRVKLTVRTDSMGNETSVTKIEKADVRPAGDQDQP